MFTIREATAGDNQALLELSRNSPMRGDLILYMDRKNDFFEISRRRGTYRCFLILDDNRIIGCWTVNTYPAFVLGKPASCNYLRDLIIDPAFQGSSALYRLFRAVHESQLSISEDLHFTTILGGNNRSLQLTPGRAGFPFFRSTGLFTLFNIIPLGFSTHSGSVETHAGASPDVIAFYRKEILPAYQFAPLIGEEHFADTRTLVSRTDGKITAVITLADYRHFKSYILKDHSWWHGILLGGIRALGRLFPLVRPPARNARWNMLYVKYFGCRSGAEKQLRTLIREARLLAYRERFVFLTMGVHQKDPLQKILHAFPAVRVPVEGFLTSTLQRTDTLNQIIRGIPFEDFSL